MVTNQTRPIARAACRDVRLLDSQVSEEIEQAFEDYRDGKMGLIDI